MENEDIGHSLAWPEGTEGGSESRSSYKSLDDSGMISVRVEAGMRPPVPYWAS